MVIGKEEELNGLWGLGLPLHHCLKHCGQHSASDERRRLRDEVAAYLTN